MRVLDEKMRVREIMERDTDRTTDRQTGWQVGRPGISCLGLKRIGKSKQTSEDSASYNDAFPFRTQI